MSTSLRAFTVRISWLVLTVALGLAATSAAAAPPTLDPIGPQSTVEGTRLVFFATATDDGGVPTLSAQGLPAGAFFFPVAGAFSWTPAAGTAGTFSVTIIATDNNNETDSEVVTITVTAGGGGGAPPTLDPIGPQSTVEGTRLVFPVTATDDGGVPTLSATGLPAGAFFFPVAGNFSWTPAAGTEGTYDVTFTATDSANQTDTEVVTITVAPPNNGGGGAPPTLDPIGPQSTVEGTRLVFPVTATDDGGVPTLSATGLPAGAFFFPVAGNFSWTPAAGTAGTYDVTFTATDGTNQTDSEVVTITVTAPTTGACVFQQESSGSFLLSMEAENFPTSVPRGGAEWLVPNNPVSGFSGATALQALPDNGVAITSGYGGVAPELIATANFQATGQHFVWVRGLGTSGSSNSVHAGIDGVESSSPGIGIAATGNYEWSDGNETFNVSTAGVHPVNVWMREDGTYFDKVVITNDANFVPTGTGPAESACNTSGDQPPVIDPIGSQSTEEGTRLVFPVTATDDDGVPVLSAQGLPAGAFFFPVAGNFSWTPAAGTAGTYSVTFTATDSANQTDTETVTVTVTAPGAGGAPPTLDPIGPQSTTEGTRLVIPVTATDDGGAPVLSAQGLPPGAFFFPVAGNFSWTPAAGTAGTYDVTFTATDSGNQTDSETVTITVTPPGGGDAPPTLDPIGSQSTIEGSTLVFPVTATDDGGAPTLSAQGLPPGAFFFPVAGNFSWTPAAGTAGVYNVTFTATDSANQTDSETVTIAVSPQSGGTAFLQDSTGNNIVSVEAENFHANIERAGDFWQVPGSLLGGFSGTSALQALADNGTFFPSNYENAAAQLRYEVEFVETGRHYIWVRGAGVGGGSDSVHVGLDSVESAGGTGVVISTTSPLSYQWSDGSHFVDVDTLGLHTVDAWVREDGTYIDKIVLTTNPNFVPTGLGPVESPRVDECQIFPSTRIASPNQDDVQTTSTIVVETVTCLDPASHAGWGVKIELDGGAAGGGSEQILTTAPYTATFANVSQAEHTIDIVLVDDTSTEQTGSDVTDSVTGIGVGDYYVAFGDSITFGTGDDDPADDASADGRNTGGGYTPILNDLLTTAKGYPHTVENEGVPGDTSIDGLARIAAAIARHPNANFYLLKFGMNDARPNATTPSGLGLVSGDAGYAGTFKDNMQQMIDAIVVTGAQVVLSKVNPALGDSATGTQYPNVLTGARTVNIVEFNLVIDELVTENSLSITPPDFFNHFLQFSSGEYSDNIHPDGVGYDSMADLWEDELN